MRKMTSRISLHFNGRALIWDTAENHIAFIYVFALGKEHFKNWLTLQSHITSPLRTRSRGPRKLTTPTVVLSPEDWWAKSLEEGGTLVCRHQRQGCGTPITQSQAYMWQETQPSSKCIIIACRWEIFSKDLSQ